MRDYQISYWIGSMYHAYIIEAESEDAARAKVMKQPYHPEAIRELKVSLHYPEWN